MQVVVVGAGIGGLATAWALTARGHAVTILEQSDSVPNPDGASGDQHRIIRRGYGSADGYATLISEAYDAWDELWRDLGTSHYVETGVLSLSQWKGDEADEIHDGYARLGIPHRRLTPAEAASRFAFLDPDGFTGAALAPEGGALLCQAIAADLLRWFSERGTRVWAGAPAVSIDTERARVSLTTGEVLQADCLVVAAGGWTTRLLPQLAGVLTPKRTHVAYVEPPEDLAAAWHSAPVILSVGGESEGWAIPPVAGTGLKFGSGLARYDAEPDRPRLATPEIGNLLLHAMAPPLARIGSYRVSSLRGCVYTFTPDDCFFGTRLGRTVVVSACSGHGYKFGAAVGRRVADAVEREDDATLRSWLRAELAGAA